MDQPANLWNASTWEEVAEAAELEDERNTSEDKAAIAAAATTDGPVAVAIGIVKMCFDRCTA
jgi:hypothetical protein